MTAARTASTAARVTRNWAECSVYIRIFPRPRDIAESKEVLRVLQRYGEVVMYRHLKYEAPNPTLNAALAIFRNETSAKSAVNASPIRFQLQQGSNGWTSKISQDASLEGTSVETRNSTDTQEMVTSNQTGEEDTSSGNKYIGSLDNESNEESEPAEEYPYADSPEIEGNALIGPEKWGSHYFSKEEPNISPSTANVSESGTAESASKLPSQKRIKKSSQRFVAGHDASSEDLHSMQRTTRSDKPLAPIKEFELTVVKSILNHQAYIERQAYYAGFNPDTRTIMAEDLKGRVPLEGLLDCSLNKPDVPLRVRLRRKETARSPISLTELWEKGKRDRGEA